MGKGTGIFKMASAMSAILGAGYGAAVAAWAHRKADEGKVGRGFYEPRTKGKNRQRRGTVNGYHPDSSRFARKSSLHGSGYAGGKLFKGHRI